MTKEERKELIDSINAANSHRSNYVPMVCKTLEDGRQLVEALDGNQKVSYVY